MITNYYMRVSMPGMNNSWKKCQAGNKAGAEREADERYSDMRIPTHLMIARGDGIFQLRKIVSVRENKPNHNWIDQW